MHLIHEPCKGILFALEASTCCQHCADCEITGPAGAAEAFMTDPLATARFTGKSLNRRWYELIIAATKQFHLLTLLLHSSKVPWLAKVVASCSIAYVFSPIQIIPSFIPFIGQIDDVAVLLIGTKLARKLTPVVVLRECEAQSESTVDAYRGKVDAYLVKIETQWLGSWK